LDEPLVVFDEFTSVVDREIAKVSALAITKAVRRSKKKFVAVTCHYDVVD
jgi:ABC-type ATPase with predicted acetyltransferase domain